MASAADAETLRQLNSFLRGELSAVETYKFALRTLRASPYRDTLDRCSGSHERRAELLSEEVRSRDGDPSTGGDPAAEFATLARGSAAIIDEMAAIDMLGEFEDRFLSDYKRDIPKLDAPGRIFVEARILPEQVRTYSALGALKASLSGS